jgi:hypothetical protein
LSATGNIESIGSRVAYHSKKETPSRHCVPIPKRDEIGMGLFRDTVSQVCAAKGVSADDVMRDL